MQRSMSASMFSAICWTVCEDMLVNCEARKYRHRATIVDNDDDDEEQKKERQRCEAAVETDLDWKDVEEIPWLVDDGESGVSQACGCSRECHCCIEVVVHVVLGSTEIQVW